MPSPATDAYCTHSRRTDPGDLASMLNGLPRDVEAICEVARAQTIHHNLRPHLGVPREKWAGMANVWPPGAPIPGMRDLLAALRARPPHVLSRERAPIDRLVFGAPLPQSWLPFVLAFVSMAFACTGMAVLIGVVSPSSRMTVLWSQLVFVPSMLLGGLMFLFSMLPDVAGRLAQLLPATQAMNAFNALAMGRVTDFSAWGSIVVLMTSGILAFALAVFLFSWDRRNSSRRVHPLLGLFVLLPYVAGILFSP